MNNKLNFTAVIQDAGGGGVFVEVPFDVEKAFGSKRPKVKATIDGIPYRGALVRTPALPGTARTPRLVRGAGGRCASQVQVWELNVIYY
jgi:hypothetical protein